MATDRDRRLVHRPDDPRLLRAAAIELMRRGLTLLDAATAIGLTGHALHQLLDDDSETHQPEENKP